MFTLTRSAFGNFEKIDLTDSSSGHGFSLAPSPGATLLSLRFGGIETLEGYQTPDELAAYKWSKSAVLMPFPNRLKDGKHTWQGRTFEWPINNRDTGNAIHGYLRERDFEVAEIRLTPDEAAVTCRFDDGGGSHAAFPFAFRFEITFSMTTSGVFRVAVFCKNTGREAMPFGFGWHPYFKIGNSNGSLHSLQLPDCQRVVVDERMIPTGERQPFLNFKKMKSLKGESLDTGFAVEKTGRQKIRLKTKQGRLTLISSGKTWPFFQIFTPPHGQSVAIEPMTCNINAFHNGDGLVHLAAGKTWRGAFELHFLRK